MYDIVFYILCVYVLYMFILHCIYISMCTFICQETFVLFLSTIMNNVTLNLSVQKPVCALLSMSLGHIPRSGIAGSYGNGNYLFFPKGTLILFSIVIAPFNILPSHAEFHPNTCEVIPHCVYSFVHPNDYEH